ncbi:armadillo-type protein [Mycena galericulata]|nr:armadillo-type protein [Mycena galericulata]
MPPLTRQPTRQSIFSWWSDSNPTGATINLHAAAKPLMRLLYHRQAMSFVKRNHDKLLSSEMIDIYASYIGWKYVSPSTKAMIMKELNYQVLLWDDARPRVASLGSGLIDLLVSVLDENNIDIVEYAVDTLSHISIDLVDARAVINAGALDFVTKLLKSPRAVVRISMCSLLANLGSYESTAVAVVCVGACIKLVALLREDDVDVIESAIFALSHIANSLDGARAVINAGVLDFVTKLLESSSAEVRGQTSRLVARLAHKSTMPDILAAQLCAPLVALLRDNDQYCSENAADALAQIRLWPAGARAIANADSQASLPV